MAFIYSFLEKLTSGPHHSLESTTGHLKFEKLEKNCFALLTCGRYSLQKGKTSTFLRISDESKEFWVSTEIEVPPFTELHDALTLSLNRSFAQFLKIQDMENKVVKVEKFPILRPCREIYLMSSPPSLDNPDIFDLRLQIIVVWKNLTFPFRFNGSTYQLTVVQIDEGSNSNSPVCLIDTTRCYFVKNPQEPLKNGQIFPELQHPVNLSIRTSIEPDAFSNLVLLPEEILSRVWPSCSDLPSHFPGKLTRFLFPKEHAKAKENRKLNFIKGDTEKSKDDSRSTVVLVKVIPQSGKYLQVSKELHQMLRLQAGAHVLLSSLSDQPLPATEVEVNTPGTKSGSLNQITNQFAMEIARKLKNLPRNTFIFSPGTPFAFSCYLSLPQLPSKSANFPLVSSAATALTGLRQFASTSANYSPVHSALTAPTEKQEVMVTLKPAADMNKDDTFNYYYINPNNITSLSWVPATRFVLPKVDDSNTLQGRNLNELGAVEELANEMKEAISLLLGLPPLGAALRPQMLPASRTHILLTGPPGSGRTSMVVALARHFASTPLYVATRMISCKPLRGMNSGGFSKRIRETLLELLTFRGEGILIIDDLDVVAPLPGVQQDHHNLLSIAAELRRVADQIFSLQAPILMLVTTSSVANLYPTLVSSDLRSLFHRIYSIPAPGLEERMAIVRCQAGHKNIRLPEPLVEFLAKKTDSYLALDLSIVLDKANHICHLEGSDIQEHHVTKALASYEPSQRRQKPQHLRPLDWENVGGLTEVKEELKKLLIWPSLYPQLFSQCKLRPQSGILLYGPPGTGKTLLAGVVAAQSQLHFISVKGPELLSKYVGASEQAVRDVFMRAQSARPCLLFFDEFDAIAPKRGHDSTGVTDRVVNQFLTQMDGVEALQGVFVLAATSQPELIDPALLRPGRLDRCLYCPLPNPSERAEILLALSRNLEVDKELEEFLTNQVALDTDGYSGADLQGLLYSAQLEAFHDSRKGGPESASHLEDANTSIFQKTPKNPNVIHLSQTDPEYSKAMAIKERYLKNFKEEDMDTTPVQPATQPTTIHIQPFHIINALKNTKASVSKAEGLRYERIAKRISKRETPSYEATEQEETVGGRAVQA